MTTGGGHNLAIAHWGVHPIEATCHLIADLEIDSVAVCEEGRVRLFVNKAHDEEETVELIWVEITGRRPGTFGPGDAPTSMEIHQYRSDQLTTALIDALTWAGYSNVTPPRST